MEGQIAQFDRPQDVSYLDDIFLDGNGHLKSLPSKTFEALPHHHVVIWANKNGVYGFPTAELVSWLKSELGAATAIEINAGNGSLARHLGILATDSHIQTTAEMSAFYIASGQKPIIPPPDVLKYEANEAVDRFRPEVVIGSFVTQK